MAPLAVVAMITHATAEHVADTVLDVLAPLLLLLRSASGRAPLPATGGRRGARRLQHGALTIVTEAIRGGSRELGDRVPRTRLLDETALGNFALSKVS